MNWIETCDHFLRYEQKGRGNSLVLIHELGGLLESFDDVMPPLAERFDVLRYDQRGAGHSQKIRGTVSLDELVDELDGLVTKLGLSTPLNLVGLALGGSIAIRFAVRYPARVGRLVVTAPAVRLDKAARQRVNDRAAVIERDGVRQHVDGSLPRSYPEQIRTDQTRFERLRAQRISADPGSLAAHLRLLASIDIRDDLPRLKAPTLLLSGIHDLDRPPAEVERTANAIPQAAIVRVESGHFIPQHDPSTFVRHVTSFLAESD